MATPTEIAYNRAALIESLQFTFVMDEVGKHLSEVICGFGKLSFGERGADPCDPFDRPTVTLESCCLEKSVLIVRTPVFLIVPVVSILSQLFKTIHLALSFS